MFTTLTDIKAEREGEERRERETTVVVPNTFLRSDNLWVTFVLRPSGWFILRVTWRLVLHPEVIYHLLSARTFRLETEN